MQLKWWNMNSVGILNTDACVQARQTVLILISQSCIVITALMAFCNVLNFDLHQIPVKYSHNPPSWYYFLDTRGRLALSFLSSLSCMRLLLLCFGAECFQGRNYTAGSSPKSLHSVWVDLNYMLFLLPFSLVDLPHWSTSNWTLLKPPIKNFTKWLKVMNVYVVSNYFPFLLPRFSFEMYFLG